VISFALGDVTVAANRFIDRMTVGVPPGSATGGTRIDEAVVLEAGVSLQAITSLVVGATVNVMVDGTVYDD
jgi:hypothetical protein